MDSALFLEGALVTYKKTLTPGRQCCKDPVLFEPLAQSVEHLTFNQVVVGSTPTRLTKHYRRLDLIV